MKIQHDPLRLLDLAVYVRTQIRGCLTVDLDLQLMVGFLNSRNVINAVDGSQFFFD
jgi:hypothetical protein